MHQYRVISFQIICIVFFCACSGKKPNNSENQTKIQNAENTTAAVSLEKVWSTTTELSTCESVLYDPERDVIYVSNINGDARAEDGNGFIAKISKQGEIKNLKWAVGLDGPKGLGIKKDKLYVADITKLREIDINTGKIINSYTIDSAKFMNDVVVSPDGKVYVSDSDQGRIYVFENGALSVWVGGKGYNRPNGLYVAGDEMILASSGDGQLKSIDFDTKKVRVLADGIGAGDGVVPDGQGCYFVSSWNGQVFFINADWKVTSILDTRNQNKNCADIEYIADDQLLLVPTFGGNTVDAYKVDYH